MPNINGPLYYERMGRTGPVMAFVHPNFARLFTERDAFADLPTILTQLAVSRPAEEFFQTIDCPMIILSGSEDGAHPGAFKLQKLVPRCEMKTLHGAGHACQLEQPWLFDQYMIEFLKKHELFPAK